MLHLTADPVPPARREAQGGVDRVRPVSVGRDLAEGRARGHFLSVAEPRQPDAPGVEVVGAAHQRGVVAGAAGLRETDAGCG